MKLCPHCKAQLDDNARFCLQCMTSLEEKEQIQPPAPKARRWPLVVVCILLLGALLSLIVFLAPTPPAETPTEPPVEPPAQTQPEAVTDELYALTQTVDGVTYAFRPATREDHPTAIRLDNYFVLVRVEGASADGIYQVPSFVGKDTTALVVAVGDGAFTGTNARGIDLGYNVRYVWGDAFGGRPLTDLYLHEDVRIDRQAFSGCGTDLRIHCPAYLENTEGCLWSDLAVEYGFHWQPEDL